ncbi:MAG: hypothetical protein LBT92_02050 [Rickettsiales bacterium]|jgi:hypothetical protein|nr:hypothetical protein [Rickettsiales bacterium]
MDETAGTIRPSRQKGRAAPRPFEEVLYLLVPGLDNLHCGAVASMHDSGYLPVINRSAFAPAAANTAVINNKVFFIVFSFFRF